MGHPQVARASHQRWLLWFHLFHFSKGFSMLAIFRLFSMVTTVIAFLRSPTGKQLIAKVKAFVTDPGNRQKAAALISKIRRPQRTTP